MACLCVCARERGGRGKGRRKRWDWFNKLEIQYKAREICQSRCSQVGRKIITQVNSVCCKVMSVKLHRAVIWSWGQNWKANRTKKNKEFFTYIWDKQEERGERRLHSIYNIFSCLPVKYEYLLGFDNSSDSYPLGYDEWILGYINLLNI